MFPQVWHHITKTVFFEYIFFSTLTIYKHVYLASLKVNCRFKSLYLKKNLPIARWNIAMGPWGGCHENEFGDDDKDDNDNDNDNEVCLCLPTT